MSRHGLLACCLLGLFACQAPAPPEEPLAENEAILLDQFAGFWLGQCIANWTGLITEMDKIGNVGAIKTGSFYTREDWGRPDRPNIWSGDTISKISPIIDFVLLPRDTVWGADDDTDIEYMYQHLLWESDTIPLSATQIREGWLRHIHLEEENYLWVSNQRALELMQEGVVPPATSDSSQNEHYAMIDAQLTTEIFGLYAPGNITKALELAYLPIRTSARYEAAEIAEFYVILYALAAAQPRGKVARTQVVTELAERVQAMADQARLHLTNGQYPAAMYDFVKAHYERGTPWEMTRDSVYQRYQVDQLDSYDITSQNIYCNGCFAAGINFGASLISLFYGEGDLEATIKIGTLCGWDSDNPTATWGGMLGYMLGQEAIEATFGQALSDKFWIHRTRKGFPNDGYDDFANMARKGLEIRRRVSGL